MSSIFDYSLPAEEEEEERRAALIAAARDRKPHPILEITDAAHAAYEREQKQHAQVRETALVEMAPWQYDVLAESKRRGFIDDDEIYKIGSAMKLSAFLQEDYGFVYDNLDAVRRAVFEDTYDKYAAPKTFFEMVDSSVKIAKNTPKLSILGHQLMAAEQTLQINSIKGNADKDKTEVDRIFAELREIETQNQEYGRRMPKDPLSAVVSSTIQSSPSTGLGLAGSIAGGLVGAGVGGIATAASAGGAAPSIAPFISTGMMIGGTLASSAEMIGMMYGNLRLAGVEREAALALSAAGGTLQGFIETKLGTMAKFGKDVTRIVGGAAVKTTAGKALSQSTIKKVSEDAGKRFIGNIMKNGLAKNIARNMAVREGIGVLKTATGETIEEGLQALVDQAAMSIGAALQDADVDGTKLGDESAWQEIWENMKGGFAGGLGFGILNLPLSATANYVEARRVKNYAQTMETREEFKAEPNVRNNRIFDGLGETLRNEDLDRIWDSQDAERQRIQSEIRARAEEAGGVYSALPTSEAPGAMRYMKNGRLRVSFSDPATADYTSNGVMSILDPKTKQVLGELVYRFGENEEVVVDSIEVADFITDREKVIKDAFKELSYRHPEAEIEWSPGTAALEVLKGELAAENPHGEDWSLKFYKKGESFNIDKKTVERIAKVSRVFNMEEVKARDFVEAASILNRNLGVNNDTVFDDILSLQSLEEAQTNPAVKEAIEKGLAQTGETETALKGGIVYLKDGQVLSRDEAAKSYADGLKAVIFATEKGNLDTALHEYAHFALNALVPNSERYRNLVEDAYGKALTDFDTKDHERFAREFEAYWKTGAAPSPGIKALFRRIAEAIRELVRNANLSPELKKVFDSMFANTSASAAEAAGADAALASAARRGTQSAAENDGQREFERKTDAQRIEGSDLYTREEKDAAQLSIGGRRNANIRYDGEFLLADDESRVFGSVPEMKTSRNTWASGKIYFRVGEQIRNSPYNYGQRHIEERYDRVKSMIDAGYKNSQELVSDVAQNYTAIYKLSDDRKKIKNLALVKEDNGAAIYLRPFGEDYEVYTAVIKSENWGKKKKLIFRRRIEKTSGGVVADIHTQERSSLKLQPERLQSERAPPLSRRHSNRLSTDQFSSKTGSSLPVKDSPDNNIVQQDSDLSSGENKKNAKGDSAQFSIEEESAWKEEAEEFIKERISNKPSNKNRITPVIDLGSYQMKDENDNPIDMKNFKAIRKWIIDNLRERTVEVLDDGGEQFYTVKNLQASFKKKRGLFHQEVYAALDDVIRYALYDTSIPTDERHKNRLWGQDVYYSAVMIDGKQYRVELRLDIPRDKNNTSYKDHSVKKIRIEPSLFHTRDENEDIFNVYMQAEGSFQIPEDSIQAVSLAVLNESVKPSRIENSILFQLTREDIIATAVRYPTWEAWMQDELDMEQAVWALPAHLDAKKDAVYPWASKQEVSAWYEKTWNEAKVTSAEAAALADASAGKLTTEEGTPAPKEEAAQAPTKKPKKAAPSEGQTAAPPAASAAPSGAIKTSEIDRRFIEKLPSVAADFLKIMGSVVKEQYIFAAQSEEEQAETEKRYRDRERIEKELAPYIVNWSKRTTRRIEPSERAIRALTSYAKRSPTAYREIYTSITEDSEFVEMEKHEVEDSEALDAIRQMKGLTAYERARLAEQITDIEIARKIRQGSASVKEIQEFVDHRKEEIQELNEKIEETDENLEKSRLEAKEESEWSTRVQKQRDTALKSLEEAEREIEELEESVSKLEAKKRIQKERMDAKREKELSTLRERLNEKREEARGLRKEIKRARWREAIRRNEKESKREKLETERKEKEAERKAAAKYLAECKRISNLIMSTDFLSSSIWVRQRELLIGIQNALFAGTAWSRSLRELRAALARADANIEKLEKQFAQNKDEKQEKQEKQEINDKLSAARKYREKIKAKIEATQKNSYLKLSDLGAALARADANIEKLEKQFAQNKAGNTKQEINDKLSAAKEDREKIKAEIEAVQKNSYLNLDEVQTDSENTIGAVHYGGNTYTVEEFRKMFFEGRIRAGFVDAKLRKALRKDKMSQAFMRKKGTENIAREYSMEELKAILSAMNALRKEGTANWERREFERISYDQQMQLDLMKEQEEILERGDTYEAQRYMKAMKAADEQERKRILEDGANREMQTLFRTWDRRRLFQFMAGNRKFIAGDSRGRFYNFLVREYARYASRRDTATNKRFAALMSTLGKTDKEQQQHIEELGKKNIKIEGIGKKYARYKFKFNADWNLEQINAAFGEAETVTYSKADLMFLAVALRNKFARLHVLYGNLWSNDERLYFESAADKEDAGSRKEMIDAIGIEKEEKLWAAIKSNLNKEDMQIVEAVRNDFEAHYDELRSTYETMFNQIMEGQDNYLPIIQTEGNSAMGDKQQEVEALVQGAYSVRVHPDKGMTHARVHIGETHQSAIETDIFKVFFAGVEREEHFVKMAPYIRRLNNVLHGRSNRSVALQERLKQMYGSWAVDDMHNYMNMMGLSPSAKMQDSTSSLQSLLRVMEGSAGAAMIAFNVPAWLAQYPQTIAPFFTRANPAILLQSALEILTPGNDLQKRVWEKSPFVKKMVFSTAEDYAKWAKEQDNKFTRAQGKMIEIGMMGQRHANGTMVAAGWWAIYQTALIEGKNEEDAILFANEFTAETQPNLNELEVSPVYRGGTFGRQILRFTQPLNVIWQNLTYDSFISKEKSFANIVKMFTAYGMGALAVAAMRGALFDGDDEDEKAEIMKKVFYYMIFGSFTESVPLVGDFVSYAAEKAVTGEARTYNKEYYRVVKEIFVDVTDHVSREKYAEALWDLVQAMALTSGAGYSQLNKIRRSVQKEDPRILLGFEK
jgi:hypothetical protein